MLAHGISTVVDLKESVDCIQTSGPHATLQVCHAGWFNTLPYSLDDPECIFAPCKQRTGPV